jgi:hypothetical protein
MDVQKNISYHQSRRGFLRATLGVAGGFVLPAGFGSRALAADHPAIGTYPDGAAGGSVFIGITVRGRAYALQGEDELKGYQLAVEHINSGHPLITQISPKTKKGVLGKEVKYGVADSAAKPNDAVQAEQRFITLIRDPKIILLDEPFEGLAPVIVRDLMAACRELAAAGQTIVLVEQNLAATLALATRVYMNNNGHTAHEGSAREIREQPAILHRHLGV